MLTRTLHARIQGIEDRSMHSNFLRQRSSPNREMAIEGIRDEAGEVKCGAHKTAPKIAPANKHKTS